MLVRTFTSLSAQVLDRTVQAVIVAVSPGSVPNVLRTVHDRCVEAVQGDKPFSRINPSPRPVLRERAIVFPLVRSKNFKPPPKMHVVACVVYAVVPRAASSIAIRALRIRRSAVQQSLEDCVLRRPVGLRQAKIRHQAPGLRVQPEITIQIHAFSSSGQLRGGAPNSAAPEASLATTPSPPLSPAVRSESCIERPSAQRGPYNVKHSSWKRWGAHTAYHCIRAREGEPGSRFRPIHGGKCCLLTVRNVRLWQRT